MLGRLLAVPMLLTLILSASAQGDNTAKDLEWKFEKGKTFYQTIHTVIEKRTKAMYVDVHQKQNQTFHFSWTPTTVKENSITLTRKFIGVKFRSDRDGVVLTYDSSKKKAPDTPVKKLFEKLQGTTLEVTLNPKTGEIIDLGTQDWLTEHLLDSDPAMKGSIEHLLHEHAWKNVLEPSPGFVPKKPKSKGSTWRRTVERGGGPIGKCATTYDYKHAGEAEKGLQKIEVAISLKHTAPTEDAKKALPFTIKGVTLSSGESKGTILFDTKKGRVKSSKLTMKLQGTMRFEVEGETTSVELDQTQTTTTSTSDKDPTKE